MTFYVFSFSIDINVDKICVRITVNSSWLIYLLNLGTCMEHLRQWTKEARSSFKLLVEITKGLQVEELVENKESSFSVEEDFVSDDDATHPFSQKEHNDVMAHWLRRLLSTGGPWVRLPLWPSRRYLGQVLYLQLPVRFGVKLRYSIRAVVWSASEW